MTFVLQICLTNTDLRRQVTLCMNCHSSILNYTGTPWSGISIKAKSRDRSFVRWVSVSGFPYFSQSQLHAAFLCFFFVVVVCFSLMHFPLMLQSTKYRLLLENISGSLR